MSNEMSVEEQNLKRMRDDWQRIFKRSRDRSHEQSRNLTDHQVKTIRKLRKKGLRLKEIVEKTGVPMTTVQPVATYKIYKHVKDD